MRLARSTGATLHAPAAVSPHPRATATTSRVLATRRERFKRLVCCVRIEWGVHVLEQRLICFSGELELPVFNGEIGDAWINGGGSDPWRNAAFRVRRPTRGLGRPRLSPHTRVALNLDPRTSTCVHVCVRACGHVHLHVCAHVSSLSARSPFRPPLLRLSPSSDFHAHRGCRRPSNPPDAFSVAWSPNAPN